VLHHAGARVRPLLVSSIVDQCPDRNLDQETLALVARAQPLPKPPPEVASDRIELVVPIAFSLHAQR